MLQYHSTDKVNSFLIVVTIFYSYVDFDLGFTESDSETSTNFTVSGVENASISFWLQMDDYVNGTFDVEIINSEERTIAFYMSLGSETFLGKDG